MEERSIIIIGPESHTDFTFVLVPERGFAPFLLAAGLVAAGVVWWTWRRRRDRR